MPPVMDNAAAGAGLLDSLRTLRRRVKLLGVAYGAGIVLASAVALVLAVVLLDYVLKLPPGPRAVVNLAALGLLGYAAWAWVVRPALARLTLSDLAGRIENTFPQFDDTLRSTVTFAEQDVPGSVVMKERTVARARQVAAEVDLSKAVVMKPVWGSIALGVGALVAFVAIAALVDPSLRAIAADRLFAGSMAWPKNVEMDLLQVPGGRIASGGEVPLRMKLNKGNVKTATVRYRFDNGPWQQEVMQADAAGVFSTKLKAQLDANRDLSKMQIRLEAGDDERDLNPVTVVPQLEVRQAIATVTPPAYSKLAPAQVNLAERPVVAATGAEVELSVTFNKQLDTAKGVKVEPADRNRQSPRVAWSFPRNGVVTGKFSLSDGAFKPEDSFKFVVRATDTDGLGNATPQEYQLTIHEDVKPTVIIEQPRQSEERTPNATVPLRIAADDDYGFDAVDLVVEGKSPNLAGLKPWVLPLVKAGNPEQGVGWQLSANSTIERKRFVAEYAWELDKLSGVTLKPGDKLEFFVRARDNFELAGKRHDPVDSTRLTISVISHDQFEAWVEMQLSNVRQEIGGIKKAVDVTRAGAEQQAKETTDRAKLDEAQRTTMSRLANQQSTATAQTKQSGQKLNELVRRMAENKSPEQGAKQAAADVAKQLDRTAEAPMKEATNKLNEAKDTKADPKADPGQQKQSAEQAAKSLDNAAKQQEQASQQLEQAMGKLNDFGGLAPSIQKMEQIKKEQEAVAKEYREKLREALGKKAEQMTDQQKKDLKDLADRQEQLAKETDKALKDMDAKADKMQKSDPQAAKAMKEAAQTGQSQAIPQKQSNPKDQNGAEQEMEKNQQANAQQKHKEIELGLDMMLDKLKAAERAKLEELQKQLAELQQLLEQLVARQAGHNIDNLLIQDPTGKKVTEISESDRKVLFEQAKRDEAKLAEMKPELAVVTPSQEQTHRNTADVARKAEALQDATPAGKITAAATQMEQAIVYLRKRELADAYKPPQVEALRNLADAKKLIDDAKQKVDQEDKDRQEESIKQAYVKLLERQIKINEQTADIDKNGKDEEGNLKRNAAKDLAALPGEQGKLSKEASDLGEKLKQIKSIVYVWANKDIITSMNEVKDDLAEPRTDAVVQTQQTRVAEQLKAMIDNLTKKPPQPDEGFADRNAPGKGQQGGKPPPKMPTDVELRLLKDLQAAVNKATTVIDAEVRKAGGKKDEQKLANEQKLLGLGGRQGELRNLLDQLIKAASEGKVALAPEPKDKDKLPEEAGQDEIEEQEFVKDLVEGKLEADTVERTVKLVGDRMGRSRQRLALDNDPGKVTQDIQKRIVLDLDNLIKLAQQQQQPGGKPKPGEGKPGEKPGQPQPGQGEGPQNAQGQPQPGQPQKGGEQAADQSVMPGQGGQQQDLSRDLKEKLVEWGGLSGRERGAVMEGKGEEAAGKYKKYVEDYFRELAKKASER